MTTPDPLDLDAIRERSDRAQQIRAVVGEPPASAAYAHSANDVPALLAEIDRLRDPSRLLAALRQAIGDTWGSDDPVSAEWAQKMLGVEPPA